MRDRLVAVAEGRDRVMARAQRKEPPDAQSPALRPRPPPAPCRAKYFADYLLLTGLARFLVEFIRINPRSFLGMSNAQTAAALSMIGGAVLWQRVRRRPVRV